MTKPLAIDLFCGLGGWTEGLLKAGYHVIGFDIERHEYGEHKYPAQLILHDVLELHGAWFKDVALIVASPPCQEYSYMAMPWSRAKAKAAAIRADTTGQKMRDLTRLFDSCFRIQQEAIAAAERHVPLVVENVRGAQPWVGKAAHNYGSFYLWGDVPEGTPQAKRRAKVAGFRFDGRGESFQTAAVAKNMGIHMPYQDLVKGIKQGGDWFNASQPSISRLYGSKSPQRKMASAMIAKIPLELSYYIAQAYYPRET